MTRNDYTIEDCLEFLTGLSLIPGQHWSNKPFKLFPENQKVLYSIGTQVFRGKALTQKQHELVKKLFVEFYVDQFKEQSIDIYDYLDKIREPYREVDKSHWVKHIVNDNESFIAIRFPFSNTVIEYINDLKKETDDKYFYNNHTHYFLFNEQNVYKVMTIVNKFKEHFEIESEIQEYYNEIISFDMNKNEIIPGVQDNKFVNIHEDLRKHLEERFPDVGSSLVSIWDKRRLYGLHNFDNIDISNYSVLGQKILKRDHSNLTIRSEVWTIDQVLSALYEIDRFPLVIALDEDAQPYDHLTTIYNSIKGLIDNSKISVMFRLDNKNNEEFNQFIRDKRLNNSIDDNTQIVIVNRKKITKPIIKSQWRPCCMLTFGQSRGYGNVFSTYIEQFDLKIYFTKEDSIISQYTRPKNSYIEGVTTL